MTLLFMTFEQGGRYGINFTTYTQRDYTSVFSFSIKLFRARGGRVLYLPRLFFARVKDCAGDGTLFARRCITTMDKIGKSSDIILKRLTSPSLFKVGVAFTIRATGPVVKVTRDIGGLFTSSYRGVRVGGGVS